DRGTAPAESRSPHSVESRGHAGAGGGTHRDAGEKRLHHRRDDDNRWWPDYADRVGGTVESVLLLLIILLLLSSPRLRVGVRVRVIQPSPRQALFLPPGSGKAPFAFAHALGLWTQPLTPPTRGTDRTGTNAPS